MAQYDYDVIVIGGGAAGLTASGVCAAFGARTALVERRRLGGDCTWYGCVPSKTLLHIAKEYTALTNLKKYGVDRGNLEIDFAKVMEAVRQTRERIYRDADAPEVMQKKGVEVISGTARFKDAHSLEIEKEGGVRTLRFRSAIITAGGSPMALNIPGLHENGFLTNESLFEINERPEHLVIMGSGPIGVEMAQAFTMLGSRVTVIALDPDILIRDERRCAAVVRKRLEEQGVRFILESTIHNVAKQNGRYDLAVGPPDAAEQNIQADALLVAVGRRPNLQDLGLEAAGVRFTKQGIPVDAHCRTNLKHIFAAGDVTTFLKFTHVAENMAKTAGVNAILRFARFKYERRFVPWVTYTDPECAHAGETAEELQKRNARFDTIEFPYHMIDRAVTEGQPEGIILLHTTRSGKILGAHAAGLHAGEIISEYALAMKNGLKLSNISDTVHPYPTMLLGARRAADQFYVRLQKRWMVRLVRFLFRYTGEIPQYVGTGKIV